MSDAVRAYYDGHVMQELERLDKPYARLEFACTMHLITKYFPPQGRIADIGGGPGRYTIQLLRRGYRVVLIDLCQGMLDLAQRRLADEGLTAEALVRADACSLDFLPSGYFDAALLMGPLYHLIRREDRARALSELRRILKPQGTAIVAYLNSWGIVRSLLTESPEYFRRPGAVKALTDEFIQEGPQTAFTEAYFTTPPRAAEELRAAGFSIVSYAGAESFASGAIEPLGRIHESDPQAYEDIVQAAASLCEAPQWRDATEHIHFVIRAPPHGNPAGRRDTAK